METLNLKDLFKYYLNNLILIILITVLTILIGYGYIEYIQIPKYKGETTIILVQKDKTDLNDSITQNQLAINEELVSTYSEIIKSRRVLDQVIEELDLNTTIKKLMKKISIESVSDTSIIKITVKDKSNKKAAEIANKIAEIFQQEITQIYNLENISIIDKAIIEKKPYNIDLIIQLPIFGILGFLIAIIVVFFRFYFNNTIKNKKELEEKIEIPVLGEIPFSNYLKKDKKNKLSQKENIELETTNQKISNQNELIVEKEKNTKKRIAKSDTNKNSKATNSKVKATTKISKKTEKSSSSSSSKKKRKESE